MKRTNFYLIVNALDVILAVYGIGAAEEAQSDARARSMLGPVKLRLIAANKRPDVGSKLPSRSLSVTF